MEVMKEALQQCAIGVLIGEISSLLHNSMLIQ